MYSQTSQHLLQYTNYIPIFSLYYYLLFNQVNFKPLKSIKEKDKKRDLKNRNNVLFFPQTVNLSHSLISSSCRFRYVQIYLLYINL